ncbi:MAG: ABC transporter substrate-binding protein [Synergistaceae bacterium]|nr:ABC transporter substrate-binding protein [Synergistaceae bacterium]
MARCLMRLLSVLVFLLLQYPVQAEIRVSDDSGRSLVLEQPAGRIVSLYAGHSENLLAIGAGDFLAAVSEGDDPHLFAGVPRLPFRADAEQILALSPDLVLMRPFTESTLGETVRILEKSGVTVASLDPPTWDGMGPYLSKLGIMTGIESAEKLWREKTAAVAKKVPEEGRPRVFLESSFRGLKTCSPSSWAAHVIHLAGGVNAAGGAQPLREGSPLAPWGEERLLTLAMEGIDVYLVQAGAMNPVTEQDVLSRSWISGLENARIVFLPEEYISRPSLFRLEESVDRLFKVLYPEGGVFP